MREIKFRAYDKETNLPLKMEYITDFYWFEENYYHNQQENHRYILMQYTGLKDKDGKEIYEDDIIKVIYFEEDYSIHKVVWKGEEDYPAFDLEPYLECEANGLSFAKAEYEIDVIGNIYENPELLIEV